MHSHVISELHGQPLSVVHTAAAQVQRYTAPKAHGLPVVSTFITSDNMRQEPVYVDAIKPHYSQSIQGV